MVAYFHPYFELDQAVMRVGRARADVATQEKRIALAKRWDDDTAQSEKLLGVLKQCLQTRQARYETVLLALERS